MNSAHLVDATVYFSALMCSLMRDGFLLKANIRKLRIIRGERGGDFFFFLHMLPPTGTVKKQTNRFEVDSWTCVSDNPPNSQTFPQPPNQTSFELSAVIWNRGTSSFCNTEIHHRKKVFTEVLETSAVMLWWGLALEGNTFPATLIDSNYAVLWIWSWGPDFAGHRNFTGVRCLNDSLLPRKSHSGAAGGWQ